MSQSGLLITLWTTLWIDRVNVCTGMCTTCGFERCPGQTSRSRWHDVDAQAVEENKSTACLRWPRSGSGRVGEFAGLADTERSGTPVDAPPYGVPRWPYGWAADDPRWTDEPAGSSQWASNGNGRLDPGPPTPGSVGADADDSWDELLFSPRPLAITGPAATDCGGPSSGPAGVRPAGPAVRAAGPAPRVPAAAHPGRTAAATRRTGASPAPVYRRRVPPDEPGRDLRRASRVIGPCSGSPVRGTHCWP